MTLTIEERDAICAALDRILAQQAEINAELDRLREALGEIHAGLTVVMLERYEPTAGARH